MQQRRLIKRGMKRDLRTENLNQQCEKIAHKQLIHCNMFTEHICKIRDKLITVLQMSHKQKYCTKFIILFTGAYFTSLEELATEY